MLGHLCQGYCHSCTIHPGCIVLCLSHCIHMSSGCSSSLLFPLRRLRSMFRPDCSPPAGIRIDMCPGCICRCNFLYLLRRSCYSMSRLGLYLLFRIVLPCHLLVHMSSPPFRIHCSMCYRTGYSLPLFLHQRNMFVLCSLLESRRSHGRGGAF